MVPKLMSGMDTRDPLRRMSLQDLKVVSFCPPPGIELSRYLRTGRGSKSWRSDQPITEQRRKLGDQRPRRIDAIERIAQNDLVISQPDSDAPRAEETVGSDDHAHDVAARTSFRGDPAISASTLLLRIASSLR